MGRAKREVTLPLWLLFVGLAFGLPLAGALLELYFGLFYRDPMLRVCSLKVTHFHLQGPYHTYLWFGPVIVCFLFNCYVYIRLVVALKKAKEKWGTVVRGFQVCLL